MNDSTSTGPRVFTIEDTPEIVLTAPRTGMGVNMIVPGLLRRTPQEVERLKDIYKDVDASAILANANWFFPLKASASRTFNPFEHFVDQHEFILKLAQEISAITLTAEQHALAERLGLEACRDVASPSIRTLVEAWRAEPSLAAFANALGYAAMPGGLEP